MSKIRPPKVEGAYIDRLPSNEGALKLAEEMRYQRQAAEAMKKGKPGLLKRILYPFFHPIKTVTFLIKAAAIAGISIIALRLLAPWIEGLFAKVGLTKINAAFDAAVPLGKTLSAPNAPIGPYSPGASSIAGPRGA